MFFIHQLSFYVPSDLSYVYFYQVDSNNLNHRIDFVRHFVFCNGTHYQKIIFRHGASYNMFFLYFVANYIRTQM